MVGVSCHPHQELGVREFFQLLKIPWEFVRPGEAYSILICTDLYEGNTPARLTIVYSPLQTSLDTALGFKLVASQTGTLIHHGHHRIPIYSQTAFVESISPIRIFAEGPGGLRGVGVILERDGRTLARIGYDLFEEVLFLLGPGQPPVFSKAATLEVQIEILRSIIVQSGLPLKEIPPRPWGHPFVVCLTHDVDFLNIRDHGWDKTFLGYLSRSLLPFFFKGWKGKKRWANYWKNLKAVWKLPAVYAGKAPDTWNDLDRYLDIERDLPSTFFWVPRPNDPGRNPRGRVEGLRAIRYDLIQERSSTATLIQRGKEIGLHGIDAWLDAASGISEKEIIREMTGQDPVGVRIHWLWWLETSFQDLEAAGFKYDSTWGYNETVGFRSGTTQAFVPPGVKNILELPLNIMDTSLLASGRMGVSEEAALALIGEILTVVKEWGGVLTINWHTRSLSPERNWDSLYITLLDMLKKENPWFATAREASDWFLYRRAIRFREDRIVIDPESHDWERERPNRLPPLVLRCYNTPSGSEGMGRSGVPSFFDQKLT
jgi:hypothetical protein